MYNVDSNHDVILVSSPTKALHQAKPMVVVRPLSDPERGYVALIDDVDGDIGGFGTDEAPSSYRRPCLAWFGPGERFLTAGEVISSYKDCEIAPLSRVDWLAALYRWAAISGNLEECREMEIEEGAEVMASVLEAVKNLPPMTEEFERRIQEADTVYTVKSSTYVE